MERTEELSHRSLVDALLIPSAGLNYRSVEVADTNIKRNRSLCNLIPILQNVLGATSLGQSERSSTVRMYRVKE